MRASIATPWVAADLHAAPGEVVAVVGPNGAGKSTLLRALAGLQPATGSIELAGREVIHLPAHERRVGWVPQDRLLFERKSALDNAAYGLVSQGVRRRAARRTALEWLERLGIGHLAGRRPAELSGGQAARVALARALAPAPALPGPTSVRQRPSPTRTRAVPGPAAATAPAPASRAVTSAPPPAAAQPPPSGLR